jgi:DNA-binding transcriptional LysR family regulator
MLDLRRIRYFVAVYEEGSIKRAGLRENVVQPAVSVQIKQLEADLRVKLFERSAQGVRPTPAGRHFYGLCQNLLRDLNGARQHMLDFSGEIAGSLKAGVMPSICRGLLPSILTRYSELYPNVEVKLLEAYSGTLAECLSAGEIEVALCNRPTSRTSLEMRLLVRDPIVLVSGPAKALERDRPCRLDEIEDLKLVLSSGQHFIRRLFDHHIRSRAIRPARVIEIDGLGATMQFLGSSDWSTMLPSVAVLNDRGQHGFIINPIERPAMMSDIYELHRPDRPLSRPAQELVRMVEEELAGRKTPGEV